MRHDERRIAFSSEGQFEFSQLTGNLLIVVIVVVKLFTFSHEPGDINYSLCCVCLDDTDLRKKERKKWRKDEQCGPVRGNLIGLIRMVKKKVH